MQRFIFASLFIAALVALIFHPVLPVKAAVKDQSRLIDGPKKNDKTSPLNPIIPDNLIEAPKKHRSDEPLAEPPTEPAEEPGSGEIAPPPTEEFNLEDIPSLVRLDLTLEIAKRAVDAFKEVGTKYNNQGLNDYPTLEEFVEKTDAGKKLQKEVQGHGFKDIVAWNTAIMNVSFAYGALLENQEEVIKTQIQSVKESTTIDEAKKLRIIASLNALIPSKENIAVIKKLRTDPEYAKKLDLLNAFE